MHARWIRLREGFYDLVASFLFAATRALGLAVMVLVHKGIDTLAMWVVPEGWERGHQLLEGVFFVAFAGVYTILAVEMLLAFWPAHWGGARESDASSMVEKAAPDDMPESP